MAKGKPRKIMKKKDTSKKDINQGKIRKAS